MNKEKKAIRGKVGVLELAKQLPSRAARQLHPLVTRRLSLNLLPDQPDIPRDSSGKVEGQECINHSGLAIRIVHG